MRSTRRSGPTRTDTVAAVVIGGHHTGSCVITLKAAVPQHNSFTNRTDAAREAERFRAESDCGTADVGIGTPRSAGLWPVRWREGNGRRTPVQRGLTGAWMRQNANSVNNSGELPIDQVGPTDPLSLAVYCGMSTI